MYHNAADPGAAMKETARIMLARLVSLYGVSIAHDPIRCEGLLRDTCPDCNREIFVLTQAVRQHIADDLLFPRHTLPLALTEAFLVKRLEDELGLSGDSARWAVSAWAEALGRADPVQEVQEKPVPQVMDQDDTDPALRDQWTEKLANGSRSARLEIITNLSRNPSPENLRLLITSLVNRDWAARSAAFDALCNPKTGAGRGLIDALHDAPDDIAWRITLVLGALREREAVKSLIPLLDREPSVRDAAIWSLGEIGDPQAATPLMKILHNPDSGVVAAASESLKKIGLKPSLSRDSG